MTIRAISPLTYNSAALTGRPQERGQKQPGAQNDFAQFLSQQQNSNQNQPNTRNIARLEQLREKIATLRGDILANALNGDTQTIPALDKHLNTLTQTLKSEETRLSGQLVNIET